MGRAWLISRVLQKKSPEKRLEFRKMTGTTRRARQIYSESSFCFNGGFKLFLIIRAQETQEALLFLETTEPDGVSYEP